jgi:endo-1,4-beta-mannosidase
MILRKAGYYMKGFIKVHEDGWNFVNAETGEIFVPYGANYFDPETGWAPKLWRMFDKNRVLEHFQKMADVGVNVARIFMTTASFQPQADVISNDGLEKLDTMIEIAEKYGIRLILTGPDHWEGSPDYWKPDKYAGIPALSALEYFWHEVADRYKDETTIFAWDLLNEPEIAWKSEAMSQKWHLWLLNKYKDTSSLKNSWRSFRENETIETAEIPEDQINAGNQRLYDYQLFREHIACEWTRRQVDAISAVDKNHPVTVGLIQWSFPLFKAGNQPGRYAAFNPLKLAPMLDFVCVHFYPILGDPGEPELALKNTQYLQAVVNYCYTGKPVILEEFGWHGGGEWEGKYRTEAYQSDWNTNAVKSTLGLVSGWLVWAYSDTPTSTDITKYGGLYNVSGQLKEWGKSFKSLASEITGSKLIRSNIKNPKIDEIAVFTGDVRELYEQYLVDTGINH